jgi:hypothetical protein
MERVKIDAASEDSADAFSWTDRYEDWPVSFNGLAMQLGTRPSVNFW